MSKVLILALASLAACSGITVVDESEAPLEAHCNPLSREHCLLPWPADFYLRADSASPTGKRVNYAAQLLPANGQGKHIDPSRHNLRDGFSIGAQPLVFFREGVSSDTLPPINDLEASLAVESPIWLLRYPSGERVPFFAETDWNAGAHATAPGLIIRPQRPLAYKSRYVVVLRSTLKNLAGERLAAPEAFARLRDKLPTADPTLEDQREGMEEVFAFVEKQGLSRKDLTLAWSFHTGSEESATRHLRFVLDDSAQRWTTDLDFTLDVTEHSEVRSPTLWREGVGELQVPSYLQGPSGEDAFALNERGDPSYVGKQNFRFRVHVPRCAKAAQSRLPLLVVGHGLFRSVDHELKSEFQQALANRLCMVQIGVSWHGLSSSDLLTVTARVVPDFSNLRLLTDRLQQAHVNIHALVELARTKLLLHPVLRHEGRLLVDSEQIYYYGISNGGIQGTAFAALQRHIKRFVFNVPGAHWSQMMERSSNFFTFSTLLARIYREPLDRLIAITLSQALWDDTDPINYAHRIIKDPIAGYPKKQLLLQEAIHDDQVPNITTRVLVRRMGLKLLEPSVENVFGIASAAGPLEAGYTQWDLNPPVTPYLENRPAQKPGEDYSAHLVLRRLEPAMEQVSRFLRPAGQVEHTCGDGACRCTAGGKGPDACVLGVQSR